MCDTRGVGAIGWIVCVDVLCESGGKVARSKMVDCFVLMFSRIVEAEALTCVTRVA